MSADVAWRGALTLLNGMKQLSAPLSRRLFDLSAYEQSIDGVRPRIESRLTREHAYVRRDFRV